MTNEDLWRAVLAEVELNISRANFTTWFKNTGISSKKDGEVIVSVPNNFTKEWFKNKYNDFILKVVRGLAPEVKEVKYIIEKPVVKTSSQETKETTLSKNVTNDDFQLKFGGTDRDTNLNARYTFDNFIVGPFNALAHAAGCAISKNLGEVYNPLFVYGGVGLGKTHLIQAIGNEIVKNFPNKKIKYIPSEKFISQLVSSIQNRTVEQFKAKYRGIDLLILDDVQFLAGKEKTQEEFFHTFNDLYARGSQIILSSDRPPRAIAALEERVRSRFEGGMVADISYPDVETRLAILKMKAQEKNANVPDETLNYIAENVQKNIRELEGALNRLIAHTSLNNRVPDIDAVKILLKSVIDSPKRIITPKKIIQAVADFYDIKEKELISESRKKEIVRPRQIAMFLFREETKSSYPFIGRKFGGKDHTTAMHACEKIDKEVKENNDLAEELNLIRQRIHNM